MKNLLYLFFAVTIFSCSSDSDESSNDNDNSNNITSLAGRWNIASLVYLNGESGDLEETCANENYFICNDNSGTMFFHFNEDTNGSIIDCFQSSSDNFSYTNSEASFTQFVFTPESGGQLIAELSDDRNNLTFTDDTATQTFTRE